MNDVEVRSFRSVFELERRIYRVDTVRLNPAGVPLRGVLYGAVLVAAVATLAQLPVVGLAFAALPWYVAYVGLPGALAALLTLVRIEGRAFHLAIRSLVLQCASPSYLSAWQRAPKPGSRWSPPPILLIPDGSDATLRRLRYCGPGALLVAVSHDRVERSGGWHLRAQLTLRGRADQRPLRRPVAMHLRPGAKLECRPWR